MTFLTLIVLGVAAALSADAHSAEDANDNAPITRAAKATETGMELFSWHIKGEDAWHFALLPAPGNDKLKTSDLILAKENAIEGTAELKKKLAALALNEKIGWFNMLDKKDTPPDGIIFDFPPREVIKELELYATILKLRLNIYQARSKK